MITALILFTFAIVALSAVMTAISAAFFLAMLPVLVMLVFWVLAAGFGLGERLSPAARKERRMKKHLDLAFEYQQQARWWRKHGGDLGRELASYNYERAREEREKAAHA